jgi:biopolymer transport protein ExbB
VLATLCLPIVAGATVIWVTRTLRGDAMDIVARSKLLMLGMGARPVLWLLILLSVISLAVALERAWLLVRIRDDLAVLMRKLREAFRSSDLAAAGATLSLSRAPAATIALAGLEELPRGREAVEQAMSGARALEKRRLERRLAFLGTLGNNAPFIGLFGTVIGIMEAFDKLGQAGHGAVAAVAGAPSADVMGGIAEALVATAVGLAVAIPAVAAYNYLQRRIKGLLADAEVLGALVLGHVGPTMKD